ncbi:unnamed protein product, partial [Rotaria magnacalcarata]
TFALKYSNDKNLESSEQHHARLFGTAHLPSRDLPSCLSFTYQTKDDRSSKLSVFVHNRTVWRSRSRLGQSENHIQLNISLPTVNSLPKATLIGFDGQVT